MGNIELTNFVKYELKGAIYRELNRVFPEMGFTFRGNRWESKLGLGGRIPKHERHDKSVVSSRKPDRILEQGGDSVEVIEYYMQQNGLSKPIDAIRAISSIVGLTPPPMEDSASYLAYKEKQDKLNKLVSKMQNDLFTPQGNIALTYLKEGRGYTEELIKGMGLGWCSLETATALREILKEGAVPTTGSYIAIPYISSGDVKGVVFRNTTATGSKYLDAFISKEATKRYNLFGLTALRLTGTGKYDKDIVVVEGELDALRANYEGLDSAVGASGKNLSLEALTEAKKMGVERVILLYDYDRGADKTAEIKKALSTIRVVGLTGIVAFFPEEGDKVDTDSYLSTHSIQELRNIIYGNEATFGCEWELLQIVKPYTRENGKLELSHIEVDKLRREIVKLLYHSGLQRWEIDFIKHLIPVYSLNTITEEAITEEIYSIEVAQKEIRQKEATGALIKDAQEMLSKGDTTATLTALESKIKEIKQITQEATYSQYMELPTNESILSGLQSKKVGIPTGYYFTGGGKKEIEWEIPTGALTYICAPTSHGKSRFLQNLALNFATDGKGGSVIYISLEEDTSAVVERLINIKLNRPINNAYNNSKTIREYFSGEGNYISNEAKPYFTEAVDSVNKLLTTGALRILSRREYRDIGYIEELSGFISYATRKEQVKAVFIDYAQEIYVRGSRTGRKEELMEICNKLMELSVSTGLPIVLASQLNREATSPLDMSVQNIADASNIEHSANCILLLWDSVVQPVSGRDNSYYFYTTIGTGADKEKIKKTTAEAQKLEDRGFKIGESGKIYAILAKNRSGERNIDAILSYTGYTGTIAKNTPSVNKPVSDGNFI